MRILEGHSIAVVALAAAGISTYAHAGCTAFDMGDSVPISAQVGAADVVTKAAAAFANGSSAKSAHTIVGLWKAVFTAQGNSGIPDGTVIDVAYVTWHRDRTELMNSSRPPKSGDFCMGVWKLDGANLYRLHHVTLAWDETGSFFVGPGEIRETVMLAQSGDAYQGTFEIRQFAADGATLLADITGTVAATRITAQ